MTTATTTTTTTTTTAVISSETSRDLFTHRKAKRVLNKVTMGDKKKERKRERARVGEDRFSNRGVSGEGCLVSTDVTDVIVIWVACVLSV